MKYNTSNCILHHGVDFAFTTPHHRRLSHHMDWFSLSSSSLSFWIITLPVISHLFDSLSPLPLSSTGLQSSTNDTDASFYLAQTKKSPTLKTDCFPEPFPLCTSLMHKESGMFPFKNPNPLWFDHFGSWTCTSHPPSVLDIHLQLVQQCYINNMNISNEQKQRYSTVQVVRRLIRDG